MRMPALQHTPNFRDLGGMASSGGRRVRMAKVYRSELLASVDAADRALLDGLDIGAVFDLRNPQERFKSPSAWPPADARVRRHVVPHEMAVAGADLHQLVRGLREATLDVQQVGHTLRRSYRAMPQHFAPMLAQLFSELAQAPPHAVLIHCTAGKDRTGFLCAMLLRALDVDRGQVMDDYLATGRFYSVQRLIAQMRRFADGALDERMHEVLAELARVRESYLEAAFDEIDSRWGSLRAYLASQAGLDDSLRTRLQAALLE